MKDHPISKWELAIIIIGVLYIGIRTLQGVF